MFNSETKLHSVIILFLYLIGIIDVASWLVIVIFAFGETLLIFPIASVDTPSIPNTKALVPKANIFSRFSDIISSKLLLPRTPPFPLVPWTYTEDLLLVELIFIWISSFNTEEAQSSQTLLAIFKL